MSTPHYGRQVRRSPFRPGFQRPHERLAAGLHPWLSPYTTANPVMAFSPLLLIAGFLGFIAPIVKLAEGYPLHSGRGHRRSH